MNSKFIVVVFAFIGKSPTAMHIALSGGLLMAAAIREPKALLQLLRRNNLRSRKSNDD